MNGQALLVFCTPTGSHSTSVRVWADSFVLDRIADVCRFAKAGNIVTVYPKGFGVGAAFTFIVPRRVKSVPSW